ncbi:MAG: hypothetical protein RLZZ626_280 [Actinomycetota bacterium]
MKLQNKLKTSTILLVVAIVMSVGNLYFLAQILPDLSSKLPWTSYGWVAFEVLVPALPIVTAIRAFRGATPAQLKPWHLGTFLAGFALPLAIDFADSLLWGGFGNLPRALFGIDSQDIVLTVSILSAWVYLAAFIAFRTVNFETGLVAPELRSPALLLRRRRFRTWGITFGVVAVIGAFASPALVFSGFAQGLTYGGNQAASATLIGIGSTWAALELPLIIAGIVCMVLAINARKAAYAAKKSAQEETQTPIPVADPTQDAVTPVAKISRPEADEVSNENE